MNTGNRFLMTYFCVAVLGLGMLATACGDDGTEGGIIDRYCPDGLVALPDGGCAKPSEDGDVEEQTQCETGEFKCIGAALYECRESAWFSLETCDSPDDCDADNGICIDSTVDGDIDAVDTEDADGDVVEVPEDPEQDTEEEVIIAEGLLKISPQRTMVQKGFDITFEALWQPSGTTGFFEATEDVTWTSDDESVLLPRDTAGVFQAIGAGEATITAVHPNDDSSTQITVKVYERAQYEARGIWINRWAFSDAQDVEDAIRRCAAYGFNQVYLQVRGRADAFYNSAYEPWAKELGTLGVDPGWDPLQVAIDTAHSEGIELHAWLNVMTVWSGSTAPADNTTPLHMWHAHPEWRMVDSSGSAMDLGAGEYQWVSPGIPEVVEHIANVAQDIVDNYDVDGIHLDRIRYPGTDYSYDTVSNTRFAAAQQDSPSLTRAQWQRDQITHVVAAIHERIVASGKHVVLSAATGGIYRNDFGWAPVLEAYEEYFQDPEAWDAAGIVDVNIPMIYWHCRGGDYGSRTDFCFLVDDHMTRTANRFLYPGSDFDDSAFSGGYIDSGELAEQVSHVRQSGAHGHVFYDYGTLDAAGLWNYFGTVLYAEPAVVPYMPWMY